MINPTKEFESWLATGAKYGTAWEAWQHQAARIAELEQVNKGLAAEAHENKHSVRFARERIAELEAQVKQLQRVPLSDEQFSEVLHSIPDDDDADSEWMLTDYQLQLIKDGIEAAHNIK